MLIRVRVGPRYRVYSVERKYSDDAGKVVRYGRLVAYQLDPTTGDWFDTSGRRVAGEQFAKLGYAGQVVGGDE